MGSGRGRALALTQGAFLVGMGLWPVVHMRSFERVTGPKPLQRWLVKTVGLTLANVGAALVVAGARGRVAPELRLLGTTVALTYAGIDAWYAGVRRRISPMYLLDIAPELLFAAAWLARPSGLAKPA